LKLCRNLPHLKALYEAVQSQKTAKAYIFQLVGQVKAKQPQRRTKGIGLRRKDNGYQQKEGSTESSRREKAGTDVRHL
jgi:hypothetical protein